MYRLLKLIIEFFFPAHVPPPPGKTCDECHKNPAAIHYGGSFHVCKECDDGGKQW